MLENRRRSRAQCEGRGHIASAHPKDIRTVSRGGGRCSSMAEGAGSGRGHCHLQGNYSNSQCSATVSYLFSKPTNLKKNFFLSVNYFQKQEKKQTLLVVKTVYMVSRWSDPSNSNKIFSESQILILFSSTRNI